MPIYEYQCEKCQQVFEELVYGDETPACPACGAAETRKLMSCCAHQGAGGHAESSCSSSSSGGGCAGCSGGNCASCGH
ncbi:MAG: zinc ribbon domain-containing protein [Desulfovibrionaceae bacterium]|nr:zinc ribbon domain-containing protein [Desulfovibrionaceae bacterium]